MVPKGHLKTCKPFGGLTCSNRTHAPDHESRLPQHVAFGTRNRVYAKFYSGLQRRKSDTRPSRLGLKKQARTTGASRINSITMIYSRYPIPCKESKVHDMDNGTLE